MRHSYFQHYEHDEYGIDVHDYDYDSLRKVR